LKNEGDNSVLLLPVYVSLGMMILT